MHILIIGGGWAGLSAAVQAVQRGWKVTLWEATRQWGGRARALEHAGLVLDNGQHILIGAYTDTLSLMRTVGLNPDQCLRRHPLALVRPDGSGLSLPRLAPPWNLLVGVLRARGWSWGDKWSLLRCAWQWQRQDFNCPGDATVAEVCRALTPRVMEQLIEPLCVSALNTAAQRASGTVFLRVLKDALWCSGGGSDLLWPTVDLGALLPDAAARWLIERGAVLMPGHRATPESLPTHARAASTPWGPQASATADAVVLACPAWEAGRLAATHHPQWAALAQALPHAAIATVYLQHPGPHPPELPQPMMALPSDADHPAQFVFDRGQLLGPSQRGWLAGVVSDSQGTREELEQRVLAQLRTQLADVLGHDCVDGLQPVQTVVEKRATFVCTPGLQRPPAFIGGHWWACGDYVQGPYPATLEGAVRSGRQVIDQIAQAGEREGRR